MRKKRAVLLCLIGAALALIGFLAYNPTSGEPSYDGHPISYWVFLLDSDTTDAVQANKATNAVDHIGVAAVPFLLKWIQYEPSRWRTKAGALLDRAPPFFWFLNKRITFPRAHRLARGSCWAFGLLGKRAMPALDDLCRLMNETNRPGTALRATTALGALGTNAVPALLAVAANANHPFHGTAESIAAEIVHPLTNATSVPIR